MIIKVIDKHLSQDTVIRLFMYLFDGALFSSKVHLFLFFFQVTLNYHSESFFNKSCRKKIVANDKYIFLDEQNTTMTDSTRERTQILKRTNTNLTAVQTQILFQNLRYSTITMNTTNTTHIFQDYHVASKRAMFFFATAS